MVLKCISGVKPRFRFRKITGGKQRLAFCNGVIEIKTFKRKKVKTKRI